MIQSPVRFFRRRASGTTQATCFQDKFTANLFPVVCTPIFRLSLFLSLSPLRSINDLTVVRLIISRFLSFFFLFSFSPFFFFSLFSIRNGDTSEVRLDPFRFPLTRRYTRGDCQSYKSAGVWLQFSINWYRAKASGPVLIPVLRGHRCVPRYQREYYIQLSLSFHPFPPLPFP